MMWVRIALSREFLASCKFEEGNKENEEDNSSESSCMTHSTIKSRMKNLKVGYKYHAPHTTLHTLYTMPGWYCHHALPSRHCRVSVHLLSPTLLCQH
ncbi:hypothetical protein EON65_24210, partial [archaeon]